MDFLNRHSCCCPVRPPQLALAGLRRGSSPPAAEPACAGLHAASAPPAGSSLGHGHVSYGRHWRARGALLPGPLMALLQRSSAQMGLWELPRCCQPHLQDATYVIYLRTTYLAML